jgi:hypothetical protein
MPLRRFEFESVVMTFSNAISLFGRGDLARLLACCVIVYSEFYYGFAMNYSLINDVNDFKAKPH